jgi:pyruvate-ferredoxin/flavodoxin oxidoreductase
MQGALNNGISDAEKEAYTEWLAGMKNAEASKVASEKVRAVIAGSESKYAKEIASLAQFLVKRSIWVFGGDGWA